MYAHPMAMLCRWFHKGCTVGVAAVIMLAAAEWALAGDCCSSRPWCYCRPPMLCHPDDYCPKPMPCAPCPQTKWCCDDYCAKPMPCVSCLCTKWCPDDYCAKPMPCVCWPSLSKKHCVASPACHDAGGRQCPSE
jgi:hypothetical protein